MSTKHPTWTRKRFGRDRVHWVAYDDRAGSGERTIVAQGYATSLVEADAAARASLAEAGLYGARRTATGGVSSARTTRPESGSRPGPASHPGLLRARRYLYTRRHSDQDESTHVRAHLVVRETPRKVHVTERSCWTGQLATEDETWEPNHRTIALDKTRLDRDGSTSSPRFRHSAFYRSREEAAGEGIESELDAFRALGVRAPCTLEDIKAAYRRRALEVHPDRGGSPGNFQEVEDAYRQLVRAAQDPS